MKINIEKLFSWKHIIFLSLIVSEKFFFTLRINALLINDRIHSYFGLNNFSVNDILISVTVLFIFSICLIYLVSKIITKVNKKISFYILILFTTFLVAISFKTLLEVADYSWSSLGHNISEEINDVRVVSTFRIVWFLIPFITSLIFIILIQKDIHKVFKFLSILGLTLFIFMVHQTLLLNNLHSNFNHRDNYSNDQTDMKKQRKVIWIIFDEFDPEIAFSNKEHNYKLSNFMELKKNSVTHHKLFSPAKETAAAIPSLLIGEYTRGYNIRNHKYYMISRDNIEIPFTMENTIFGRLKSEEFSSSITGWAFHPYCFIFKIKCKGFTEPLKWYDGILHLLHVSHIYSLLHIGKHMDVNSQIINSMYKFIESPTNLVFIHNKLPHLCYGCKHGPAGYAEKFYKHEFKAKDRKSAYRLNIKLVDSIIGNILNRLDIDENKEQNTLLILSSDHWYKPAGYIEPSRSKDPKNSIYPVLFIAKILGDNQKIKLLEPNSGIYIQELVHKFLKKEISTHLDIKHFFEQKSGYHVLLEELFIVEDF